MEKILISACLLGEKVRYDAQAKPVIHHLIESWYLQGRLVSVCPEVAGGLSVPRAAAERRGNQIISIQGQDVSDAFQNGALIALKLVQTNQIKLALLKANSPSCGNEHIYDGQFRGILIEGEGVTAHLLRQAGIQVFNEHQLSQLQQALSAIESDFR